MSMSGLNALTGFDALSPFHKPAACEFNLVVELGPADNTETNAEPSTKTETGTVGWRPGERRIYHTVPGLAGFLSLPKPLNEMTRIEIERHFSADDNHPIPQTAYLQLWSKVTGTALDTGLPPQTVQPLIATNEIPFLPKFPRCGNLEEFEIRLLKMGDMREAVEMRAALDLSRQYSAEGPQWVAREEGAGFYPGETIPSHRVEGWRKLSQ